MESVEIINFTFAGQDDRDGVRQLTDAARHRA